MKCNLVCVTISLFTVVLNVYFIFIYHYFFWPVGMAGTKHQSLFQPTEEGGLLTRALPSHDLCDSCLYVTPSGYRFMSHEVKEIDGKLMNYKLNMFVGRDWVTEYLHKSILWVTKVCSSFLLGKERMIVKDDSSVVTVRPKHYKFFCIGNTLSFMKLRVHHSILYCENSQPWCGIIWSISWIQLKKEMWAV